MTDVELTPESRAELSRANDRLNRWLQEVGPDLFPDFYSRQPRYQFYGKRTGWRFCYTTERMDDGKFHSFVYKPVGKGARAEKASEHALVKGKTVKHRKRKDAEARASRLHDQHLAKH